jgi:ribosome-associated protein
LNLDIRKLQRAIVDGLEDVKAQNIAVFNTEHLSSMFERVIVASGTSNRQTKALAASVRDAVKSRGMQVLSTEGEDNGEWIIVDCGAAVAHIMQPAVREYYHLEEIWGGKPVRLKAGDAPRGLPKASEPDADTEPPPRKTAARKTARTAAAQEAAAPSAPAKRAPARKAAVGKATAPARPAPAKKAAAAPAKPAPARKAPAPRKAATAAKPAPAKKAPAKPAPAKKAAAKKAAPARKAPARKAARPA